MGLYGHNRISFRLTLSYKLVKRHWNSSGLVTVSLLYQIRGAIRYVKTAGLINDLLAQDTTVELRWMGTSIAWQRDWLICVMPV